MVFASSQSPAVAASATGRRWSLLPDEILIEILRRLNTLQDFFAVRAVCRNWRIAASPSSHTLSSQSPLLLLVSNHRRLESLYDISARRLYSLRRPVVPFQLTLAYSHGHLITSSSKGVRNPNLILKNLFTGAEIDLPAPRDLFSRVLISARPDSDNYLILLFRFLTYDTVQYLNAGDSYWTVAKSAQLRLLHDLMFFRGELLALTRDLEVVAVELNGDSWRLGKFGDMVALKMRTFNDMWLAESDGAILVVFLDGGWSGESSVFHVFRWNSENNEWEEIRDLGVKALFVSNFGSATLISTVGLGLRNNCVYWITYRKSKWFRFSLEDQSSIIMEDGDTNLFIEVSVSSAWVFPSNC